LPVAQPPVLYVHVIGALFVLYAGFMIFRRPIVVRRQHADGLAGFLGGVTGGAAASPARSSPSGAASRVLARSASAGIYQPFILTCSWRPYRPGAVEPGRRGGPRLRGIVYVPAMLSAPPAAWFASNG
jgi:hypothetical protein